MSFGFQIELFPYDNKSVRAMNKGSKKLSILLIRKRRQPNLINRVAENSPRGRATIFKYLVELLVELYPLQRFIRGEKRSGEVMQVTQM